MSRSLDLNLDREVHRLGDLSNKLKHRKNCRVDVTRTKNKIENFVSMAENLVTSGRLVAVSDYKIVYKGEEEFLRDYVDKAMEDGDYVLDLETTGLDVFKDIIVGVCLYSPSQLPLYIPINHTDIHNIRWSNQIEEDECKEILKKLMVSETRYINHNTKYDASMGITNWGIKIKNIYFDTMIGSKLLNENEKNHKLKYLYAKYIEKDDSKWEGFGDLFEDIPFNYVPIEVAGVYGGNDGKKEYELYQFQKKHLDLNSSRKDMRMIAEMMFNVEMPLIPHLIDMELRGVEIREDFAKELEVEYGERVVEVEKQLDKFVEGYRDVVLKDEELARLSNDGKVNYNSPTQLARLLYKVFKLPVVDRKNPTGTGKDIMEGWVENDKIKKEYRDWVELLQEYKMLGKLLSTYIIKIPKVIEVRTNAVHTNFNQYGADTGRFSSSHPISKLNLQNIPAKNKEIRKIFKAREGYKLIGSDYSQIEPRTLASLSGDESMIEDYKNGRDLYSSMASKVYKVPYEDCLEFRPDGSRNDEGKKRRNSMKSVLLGIMYERGDKSIADQFGQSLKWAEDLVMNFKTTYPKIEMLRVKVIHQAETLGYVNTLLGRKRRLPDMKMSNKDDYRYQRAHRQCLNAVIQGTSADIMKLAMIEIGNNEDLKRLGFKMLITVHDELIGECPEGNVKEVLPIYIGCMRSVGEKMLGLPMSCDAEVTGYWYGEDESDKYMS